jgi:integrase
MPKMNDPIKTITSGGRTRYRVIVDAGLVDGKRKQVCRTFDKRTDARKWLTATRAAVAEGRYAAPRKDTLQHAVDAWLTAKEGTVRPATLYDYRSGIKAYTRPLGDRPLQSLTRADIEDVVNGQYRDGKSVRTVAYSLGLLQQVLARSVEEGAIMRNPAASVQAKGKPSADPDAFTGDELARIAAHIRGDDLEHAYTLTLLGLRRSEVLGLQWADIDLKSGVLAVERSRVEKTQEVGAPKTRRGKRALPVDASLSDVLKAALKRQGAIGGYIVVDELGRPMRPERYSDAWRAMLADAGVRYLDLRAARRSAVTAMRNAGVPDHIVAAWHGHDEAVMRRHYSVAHDDRMMLAAGAMADVLRPAL